MSILSTRHTKSTWHYHMTMMFTFESMYIKCTAIIVNDSKENKTITILRALKLSELLALYSSGV